jgi:5-methylcytosine-specific restriction endonuclease McrA
MRDKLTKKSSNVITHHRCKGIKVNMTMTEIRDILRKEHICTYCGKAISGRDITVDRVDNADYMDRTNIQLVCLDCNTSKNHRTHREFVEYCRHVVELNDRSALSPSK